jgi:hypothetical protein
MEDLNKARGDGLLVDMDQRLHSKQIECLKSLYRENKKLIFVPCGRKFGKSELAGYVLWRHALLNPGSACYYIAPEGSHGRKIMWDTQRLQRFLGKDSEKYLNGNPNNLEMKVKFKNGSFIQIFGSENWAAANGLTPAIVVYDEFKIFNPKFHIEMDPNRAAKSAPLVLIGTMPKVGDRNKEQYEALLEYARHNPDNTAVHTYTTFDNPINLLPDRKEAIMEQIKILRARGEEDVIQREYYSKIVPGGSRAVFPMLSEKDHILPHHELIKEISRDLSKLEWYCIADPGTSTCFGALFIALNPYTKVVYILNEIYEKDQQKTSTRQIYTRMQENMKILYPKGNILDDWYKTADEAAAWFIAEVMDQFFIYFSPTDKYHNKKEEGLSLIKDQLIHGLIKISDRCKHLFKEMQEYAKNDQGGIPKKNDHLIDCLRYFNGSSQYNMHEIIMAVQRKAENSEMIKRRYRNLTHEDKGSKGDMDQIDDISFDFD